MLLPKIGTCASAFESGPYIRYELFWSPLTLCDEMKTIINKFYGVRISSLMENLDLRRACSGACRGWTSSIVENLDLGRNGLVWVLIWILCWFGLRLVMGFVKDGPSNCAGCSVGWLLFWQLHMLVGVKKYIILLLCCVK